jgi:hypothetical protein
MIIRIDFKDGESIYQDMYELGNEISFPGTYQLSITGVTNVYSGEPYSWSVKKSNMTSSSIISPESPLLKPIGQTLSIRVYHFGVIYALSEDKKPFKINTRYDMAKKCAYK